MMTTPPVDTNKTLEIAASPGRMFLGGGLVGLAFVSVGWFMSQAIEGMGHHSAVKVVFVGWVALIFSGPITILIFWRLFTQRGTVVTLSPQGLRYIRVSPDTISWPAIARLFIWSQTGTNIMIAALKPGEEAKLKLTAIARMTCGANAKLGADGLAIAAQGLKIKHPAPIAAATAYAERYGSG